VSSCLINIKTWGFYDVPVFLASVLDGGEWSVSSFVHFPPGERALRTRYVEVSVDPKKS
jgi:hypothetical protein